VVIVQDGEGEISPSSSRCLVPPCHGLASLDAWIPRHGGTWGDHLPPDERSGLHVPSQLSRVPQDSQAVRDVPGGLDRLTPMGQ